MAWLDKTVPESMLQEVVRTTNATVRYCGEQISIFFTVLTDADVPAELRGTKISKYKTKFSLGIRPAEK